MSYTREVSDETKRKISAANQGKVRTPETKQAISQSKIGTKHSEETKAKIATTISNLWSKVPQLDKNKDKEETKPIGFN